MLLQHYFHGTIFSNTILYPYYCNDPNALIKCQPGMSGYTETPYKLRHIPNRLSFLPLRFCCHIRVLGAAAAAATGKQLTTLVYNNCAFVYIVYIMATACTGNNNNNVKELLSNILVTSHLSPTPFFSASIYECMNECRFVYIYNYDLLLLPSPLLIFL